MPEDYQNQNEKEHCEFRNSIKKIDEAIFGDGNGNKGMQIMVKEMHVFFTSGKTFSNVFIMLLKVAALISVSAIAIAEFWKKLVGR